MATQTGSFDFKAMKAAKDSAEKVATNFVATDSNGMMVYDGSSGQHTPTTPGTNTSNVLINSDSVDIRQGTDVLATFGTTTRVGKDGAENVTVSSDGITINTSDKESAMVLSSYPFENSYGGEIDFGGDTTISGGADNDTSIIMMQASAPANTKDALLICDVQTPAGAEATVEATITAGAPRASMGAQNSSGSKSSTIEVSDEAVAIFCVNGSKDNDTIIDSTGITTNGKLTIEGHDSPIGTVISAQASSSIVVPSGTSTAVCSIELPAGTWLLRGFLRIPTMGSDRTKYVEANFSSTSGATGYYWRAPCESIITETILTQIVSSTTTTTYYMNVTQTSGSSKTFVTGSTTAQNIRAVRIA